MEPSFSPDGTVRIDWEEFDGLMSHVIYSPQIRWVATGEPILEMGSDWDGKVEWIGTGNAFVMHFRRYASGGNISAMIEPSNGVLRIGGEDAPAEPLADGRRRLEEEIEKTVKYARQPLVDTSPLSLLEWLGLAFIVLALVIVAVEQVQKRRANEKPRKEPPKIIREIPKPMLGKPMLPNPPASQSRNNPE